MHLTLQDFRRRYLPRKLKWRVMDLKSLWRRLKARERVLPDFLIVGAQKSGTTYLLSALSQSPNFVSPALKEIHYFDVNFKKGEKWYRGLLPSKKDLSARKRQLGSRAITGEASPFYLYYPHAAGRAYQLVPDLKIIAVLRDPVDRAISHYNHSRAWGFEPLSIEAAFAAEESRLAPEKELINLDPHYVSQVFGDFSYIDRGYYVRQLKVWEKYFTREQMLILDSRKLFSEPQATLEEVCGFLNIPNFDYVGGANRNITSGTTKVSDTLRQRLQALFEDSNKELFRYTGIRF